MNAPENEPKSGSESSGRIPLAEWIVAGFGLALVICLLGFLIYRVFSEQAPPAFAAHVIDVEHVQQAYAVKIDVANEGGQPVANLRVLVGVLDADSIKSRELEIDYLPSHSSREVTVLFSGRPDPAEIEFEFLSYQAP